MSSQPFSARRRTARRRRRGWVGELIAFALMVAPLLALLALRIA